MKYLKLYLNWLYHKVTLSEKEYVTQIKEGEVYWCAIGENIGGEENGKGNDFCRPVLIIKKFNNQIFWGLPMSTKNKENKYYVQVILKDVKQSVMISQLRILDTKRLDKKVGYISRDDLEKVRLSVVEILHPPQRGGQSG